MLLLSGCVATSFSGSYVVPAGQTLRGDLVATSGSVTLEEGSRVTGTIFLTSGLLRLAENSHVGKDVVVTSGDVQMADGATIGGDIVLSSQDIGVKRDPGARVGGTITSNIATYVVSAVTQRLVLYCVVPAVLLVALVFGLGAVLGRSSRRNRASVTPAVDTAGEPEKKLMKLKAMLDQGLITEEDYTAKKRTILDEV
jgi:uncharacterized membrane protein